MKSLSNGVSWKQRPLRPQRSLRPQNLKTKTSPYFWGLQNYDQPVANLTESWALATRILRLLLTSWTGNWGIGFVLNRKTSCLASSKKLTSCLFEVFNFHSKWFRWKMKVWLLLLAPKTVIIHAMQSTFSAMFSGVSTASYTVGAWQKQVLCFRFLRGFWKTSYWRHVRRKCYVN